MFDLLASVDVIVRRRSNVSRMTLAYVHLELHHNPAAAAASSLPPTTDSSKCRPFMMKRRSS